MQSSFRLPVLLLVATLAGCDMMDKPSWIAQKQANTAAANYYAEELANGRTYVIGSEASLQMFKASGELPLTQMFIGKGPNGETVVLEADAKDPGLQARLRREFESRHNVSLK